MSRSALSPSARTRHLATLARTTPEDPLDILVIGGGINGAGAAFDAATRGLSVGLVEKNDLAHGTSSRSSKLMHGGLRYLQMLDFSLVAEALRERDLLLTTTAPHLVRPLSFMFPMKNLLERGYIGSGIVLYDAMQTLHRAVPRHRHLFSTALNARVPGLDASKNAGAIEYFDAQMDDARFVMMLARSAANLGAAIATYTEVIEYLKDGEAIIGARVRDTLTGEEFPVYARRTILGAGVWTGRQQDAAGSAAGLTVLASKGIHITVPRSAIQAAPETGIITTTASSVLFIIPWDDYWLIGTTDTAYKGDIERPEASSEDIDYVLEQANRILARPLSRDDVIGTFAGLRPLLQPVKGSEGGSAKVSREHTVMEVAPRLSAIAGGKYTTYRVMAEDVVDFALREQADAPASRTTEIPVIGGAGYAEMTLRAPGRAAAHGIDEARLDRLLFRYGTLLDDLFDLMDADPSLAAPLAKAPRYLRSEIVYAARAEGVVHLADALMRRTRLDYEVKDRGVGAAPEVAALLAAELGWDKEREATEIANYTAAIQKRLAAEAA
ncbi:MAG: glycerol-3-phosphate dehydrogenase/oxidase [Dermabacter sp.]|nr:glycerol-3-phosphate dehydrogenase/oxidase [Dermabacter sp.]